MKERMRRLTGMQYYYEGDSQGRTHGGRVADKNTVAQEPINIRQRGK